MANFLLTQTGEEVQEILNQAPETQSNLETEVTNREEAVRAEREAREQADTNEVTARNEAIAQALATALADYYTQQEVDGLMNNEVTARNQAIATAIAQTIADYYTKAQIDTTLEDYATIAGVAATLADYYTKTQVDASLADIQAQVTALIEGTTPSKLADNLTSWNERGETPSSEEWSDVVRTTGGDMSIDSTRGAKLLSIVPLQPFYADTLKATGFNLLHDAVAVGSGYYFEVPALTYGLINTAEQNNGLLFTSRNGDNLRPVVYFKPLTAGVPAHANDGEVCAYTDAGGYRFYTCNEPGYIIVSNITFEDTCAHIAWSRRYGEFIAPDAQGDAGSSIDLATLIHTVHSYDLLLRAARGEEIVYDEIRFVSGNANWYRRVDRVQPEWTTIDNGDETYTHTATISGMKQNGVAQCGTLALTVNGTTISYTDASAEATTDYVLYQLATAANGSVEMSNDYAVEDWGLEILTDVIGTADLTTQYYQSLPDAIAALLTKVPALRTAITQEAETRVQNEKQIRLDLEAEENRARGAEQTLQGNINSEAQTRQQADTTLQGNIDAEAQTRQQADQTLQGNIDAEKNRAEGAEGTLQGNIDAEAQSRQDADAAINAKIPQAASSSNLLVDRQYLAEQIALEVQARQGADADLQTLIDAIVAKIPSAATAQNQLADKAFVNSSIASNTGSLITDNGQPWQSLADLEAYSGTLHNNDYAFVVTTDQQGNTIYNRYKYNASTQQWAFEYALNNSSFTAAQFAAINSGITDLLVTKLNGLPNATELATQISTAITTALASYYTKSEIDTTIAGYYTKQQIDTIIADYSTTTQINTAISTAIATALADYYTKTQIDTLIADYSTTAQMTAAITNALADYYTKMQIDTLIADYSTTQQMTTAISNAITTALASYSTTQDMNTAIATALSSYYTKTEIDNLLTGYATSGALSSHTGNTTVHITAQERTAWNAKANQTDLTAEVTRAKAAEKALSDRTTQLEDVIPAFTDALPANYTLEGSSSPTFDITNKGAAERYIQQMGGYLLLVKNGNVYAAKLNPNNWGKFADGSTVTSAARAATETMIHLPECHFKASGKTMYFGGLAPVAGGNTFKSPQWVGAYQMSSGGHSRPGGGSAHSNTMSGFWSMAQAIGAGFGLANWGFHCLINALFQARYGNLNSEDLLYNGITHTYPTWSAFRDLAHGQADSLADGSGCVIISDTYFPTKLFGFEDLFGKLWEFRPGIRFYMDSDVRKAIIYNGNLVSNTVAEGDAAFDHELSGVLQSASGQYASEMELGEYWDMLPKVVGGSATTYYCDGYWASTGGELLIAGGVANNGSRCGLACVHSDNAFSSSYASFGARLAFYGNPQIVSGSELLALLA